MQLAGVVVSLAGVLAILSQGSLEMLTHFELNRGDLLVILSMLLWSIYTICLRWKPAGLHMLTFLFVIACIGDTGDPAVLPAGDGDGWHLTFTLVDVVVLLCVALFSSVLAYIFWNRGVEEVGASVAGLFVHLMPVFGTHTGVAVSRRGLRPITSSASY